MFKVTMVNGATYFINEHDYERLISHVFANQSLFTQVLNKINTREEEVQRVAINRRHVVDVVEFEPSKGEQDDFGQAAEGKP